MILRGERVQRLDRVGNLYEISRCQRCAAVFYIVAYGATIGSEAPGARSAGRPMHTMSRELELVTGRLRLARLRRERRLVARRYQIVRHRTRGNRPIIPFRP